MSQNTKRPHEVNAEVRRRANSVARKNGYGRATLIALGTKDRVLDHVPFGYRKNTTYEYVPNAYRNKFGWKNTFYQNAETTVEVDARELIPGEGDTVETPDGVGTLTDAKLGTVTFPDGDAGCYAPEQLTKAPSHGRDFSRPPPRRIR